MMVVGAAAAFGPLVAENGICAFVPCDPAPVPVGFVDAGAGRVGIELSDHALAELHGLEVRTGGLGDTDTEVIWRIKRSTKTKPEWTGPIVVGEPPPGFKDEVPLKSLPGRWTVALSTAGCYQGRWKRPDGSLRADEVTLENGTRQPVTVFRDTPWGFQACQEEPFSFQVAVAVAGLVLGTVGFVVLLVALGMQNRPPSAPGPIPPAWYPDPWRPGEWVWWSGTQWLRPPPPAPLPRVRARTAARLALTELRHQPRPYLAAGTIMLGTIGAGFLTATYGVGRLFGYNWFLEPPPTTIATTAANISMLFLVVLVAATGSWSFGAFAALGLGEPSVRNAYRKSGRQLVRDALIAIPGFAIGVLALMSVVLGPVVVGLLATFAVGRVARAPGGATVSRLGRGITLGMIPTALSAIVWVLGWVAAQFPSPATWLAAVFFVWFVSTAAFCMAWLAVANAVTVLGETPEGATSRTGE